MNAFDRELRARARALDTPVDEGRLRETARRSQQAFLACEAERPLSWFEFLYEQSAFLQKRWWAAQGGLLLALLALLCCTHSDLYIQRSLGTAGPLFALAMLPELWKNQRSDALEVEGAAYYSLRQIYAARMLLFALADAALLSLFFAAAHCALALSLFDLLTQFFLPFAVTCCICFRTLCSRRFHSELFALLLCSVWVGVWTMIVLTPAVYDAVTAPAWCGVLALAAVYLGYCAVRVWQNCETIWEGTPI